MKTKPGKARPASPVRITVADPNRSIDFDSVDSLRANKVIPQIKTPIAAATQITCPGKVNQPVMETVLAPRSMFKKRHVPMMIGATGVFLSNRLYAPIAQTSKLAMIPDVILAVAASETPTVVKST